MYSYLSLDPNISVMGDEDGFVKMWDSREDSGTSVMNYKRFDEDVSSFLKMDDNHLLASSDEGTKSPDIQPEVYESELNCMATVRSGTNTKLCVSTGVGSRYLFK